MFAFLRRHVVWVVVLVLGVAVAGGVVLNSQAKAQKAQAAKVAAAKAPKSPFVAIANGKADVEGGMIQVAARRAGIVRQVQVSEGDRVTPGQVQGPHDDHPPRVAATAHHQHDNRDTLHNPVRVGN